MINFYIYLAVIVSGASVLAIELLGTRIIAPFYGVSLYLWSALISVTLAALSVGYALGGRWADRGPRLARFCAVMALAGLWIAAIPWLRLPVLAAAEPVGLRAAVLITATILFFPPLALLGTISPYAIRLKARSLDVVGRTAGNLFAVSTVASVAAALVTGFVLIPNVGVYRLVFLIGFLLVATALLGFAIRHRFKAAVAMPLLLAAGAVLLYRAAPARTADPDRGVLAIDQSAYGELRVVEMNGLRYMIIDGGTHTIVDPQTWDSYFPYVHVLDLVGRFFPQPGGLLLLGLGGGSVAKSFYHHGWDVDAVEIDPVVAQLAHTYFGLRPEEASVYEMDARQYLITHDKTYPVIIMDAFGSSSIPFHLVTREAFGLIRKRLTSDGIFAMNMEAVGWHDMIVRALAATAREEFEHVVVLPIAEPPNQIGNLVMLASDHPIELEYELPAPFDRFSPDYDRVHAWDNRFTPDISGVQVLTDELNPISIWSERVNLVARKRLHEFFKSRGVSW